MFKKAVLFLLGIILVTSNVSFAYSDISDHWAKNYINNMKNAGVLGQFEDSNIYPDWLISRSECAELISDFAEIYCNYKPPYDKNNFRFNDLVDNSRNTEKIRALSKLYYHSAFTSPTDYFYDFISKNRIIEGFPDGDFKPDNYVTRAEFAKMLVSALDCFGHMTEGNAGLYYSDTWNFNGAWDYENERNNFHWGYRYIDICYGINVMNGYYSYRYPDGTPYIEFRPDGNITRAEAIKMVSGARNMKYVGMPGESDLMSTRYDWDTRLNYID